MRTNSAVVARMHSFVNAFTPFSSAQKPFRKSEKKLGRNYGSHLHSNSPHASLQAPSGRQWCQVPIDPGTDFTSAAVTSIVMQTEEEPNNDSSTLKKRGSSRPALALKQPSPAGPQSDEGHELLRRYEAGRTHTEPGWRLRSCSPVGSFDSETGEKRQTMSEEEDDDCFEVERSVDVQWKERELSLLLEEYCTGTIINPRRACAARVTIVVPCVCG